MSKPSRQPRPIVNQKGLLYWRNDCIHQDTEQYQIVYANIRELLSDHDHGSVDWE